MATRNIRVGLFSLALAALGVSNGDAQERSFEWRADMSPGQVLEVRGVTGAIRAELAQGRTAEVVAEKHGRQSDFDDVEIRIEQDGDRVTVCAVYYPADFDDKGCDRYDDGHDGDKRGQRRRGIDVDVDFVVKLPADVEFVGVVVSGDVRVEGARSDVSASSVSGDIDVSTSGVVRASTVSGSLDLTMGSDDWRKLHYRTVSGDITLTLPGDLSAEIEFESLSGDLDSDFPVTLIGKRSRRWTGSKIHGMIGDKADRSLTFSTVSGDVRLRKAN